MLFQKIDLYARLFRAQNLLLLALSQFLVRYGILQPILGSKGFDLQMSLTDFMLLVFASMLVAAGGNVINDYFDIRIDEVNKPEKVILQKKIPLRQAVSLHYALTIAGCAIGIYVAYRVGNLMLGFIFVVVAMFLYFYSLKYKRIALAGNLTIAFLAALSLFIVWLFEFFSIKKDMNLFRDLISNFDYIEVNLYVFSYVVFAFFVTLIREMVKDIEDYEGDKSFRCRTLPIIFGKKRMQQVVMILSLGAILLTAYGTYKLFVWNNTTVAWYCAVVLGSLWIYYAANLWRAGEKKDFHFLSNILKIIILAGILSMQLLFIRF